MGADLAQPATRRPAGREPAARTTPARPAPTLESAPRVLRGGRPLPPSTRERMEAAFGGGLEHVRVHDNAEAAELVDEHDPEALAVGAHIAFGPGSFRPETEDGARLLAHELAHVVQRAGGDGPARVEGPVSEPSEPAGREAELAAARAVRGEPAGVAPGAAAWTTRARIMRRARTAATAEAEAEAAPAEAETTGPAEPEHGPGGEARATEAPAAAPATKEALPVREPAPLAHTHADGGGAPPVVTSHAASRAAGSEPEPADQPGPEADNGLVEPVARGPPGAAGHASAEPALARPPIVQTKLTVSAPGDALEREADGVADRVLRADSAPASLRARGAPATGPRRVLPPIRGPPAAEPGALPRSVRSVLAVPGGGAPLDAAVRARVEPHLGVDLGRVRVRRDPAAAAAARDLHARAFTSGPTIFLAAESSPTDVALMAHEAAHVAQQASEPAARTTLMRDATDFLPDISVDDLVPDWILDAVRDAIRLTPGYLLLTYVTGTDPLTGERVTAGPAELVEKLLTYGPFGPAVGTVLEAIDVLGEVFTFLMEGLEAHGLTFARIERDIDAAWDELSVTNGVAGNVAIVRRYVDAFLRDVLAFVEAIVELVLDVVRRAVVEVVASLLEASALSPVWSLTTKVLRYDPLRGVEVEASTAEIIADFLRLIGEEERLAQMEERGTLQATADWLDTQLLVFSGLVIELGMLYLDAWAAIQPQNLPDLLMNLEALAARALDLVAGVGAFATTVILTILELIKDALLEWLGEVAESVPGFHMLTVILEENPFTGEPVPRTAENLIRGFISLLPGGDAMYDQLAESGVIADAAARIEGAMASLGITLELVTGIFLGIWNTLTLDDLLDPVGAFMRVLGLFGEPLARLVQFVGVVIEVVVTLVLRLMNFPTELLGSVISNTLSAIADIRRDPVGFLLNMMEALKAGFTAFFDNILKYLLDGLVSWLFRGLGQLGITLPADFSLGSILDLIFQVLGLTVEHLWEKLAEHIGAERVAMIRDAIDTLTGVWSFIVDVQREGLPAIWRYVQDQLSSLWQTLLQTAMEWVMTQIITSGTIKLLSFLDPTFIMSVVNGCIALFNAVQAAIEYLRDMLEILNLFVGTLAQVAAGNLAPGVEMIEAGLAAVVPVAIGFLAYLLGIDDVPRRIADVVRGVRETIDRALDWLIEQALRLGGAVLNALTRSAAADEEAPVETALESGEEQAGPGLLEPIAVPFDMEGTPHTWIVRETADGSVEVVIASDPIDFTTRFRQYYNELDDWRHYLASIRDRLPPDVQRQVDAKLTHLLNIRRTQVARYTEIYERTFGTRRGGGSEGHEDPARERGAVRALRDLAENDARLMREWAAQSDITDISRAAVGTLLRTLASPAFNAVVAQRRAAVDGILAAFRTPNGQPVEYRGSLDEGVRSPAKAGVRFNPDDFDLDLYVVDAAWHATILAANNPAFQAEFRAKPIPAARGGPVARRFQTDVVTALEAPGAVPGLRLGANYIIIRYERP